MSVDMSFNTTEITLKFLANSVYQEMMEQRIAPERPSRDDYLFYNERVLNMMKEMLDGKYPNNDIKKDHLNYVDTLIEYMKLHDRTDILQKEYSKQVSFSKYEQHDDVYKEFDMSTTDKCMMNIIDHKQPTLDDFVLTKKVVIKEPVNPPTIREIDIKTESHKTKGLTQKIIKIPC